MDKQLQNQIRRLWSRDKNRTKCKQNARVVRGKYKCEDCKQLFGPKEVHIHHIIAIETATDWNSYMAILFCDIAGLKCLCTTCHLKAHNGCFRSKK
jgi:hypothetical protein